MNNELEYEPASLVPLQELDSVNVNGGGVPVAVFIAVAGVTVYAGAFIAQVAFYYNYAVGQTKTVSVNG